MEINQLVKEFIKYYFKGAYSKENEIIGVNINSDARVYLIEDNGIILKFKKLQQIKKDEVENYFNRITLNGFYQVYYYNDGISIYTRYRDRAEGKNIILRALNIFENFKTIHKQYILFSNLKSSH